MFPFASGWLQHVRPSRLERSGALPQLRSVGEFAPGYEASTWDIRTPRNTPTELIGSLNRKINAAVADPKMNERLACLGCAPSPMSPAEFGKLIVAETEKWGRGVKFNWGVKPN